MFEQLAARKQADVQYVRRRVNKPPRDTMPADDDKLPPRPSSSLFEVPNPSDVSTPFSSLSAGASQIANVSQRVQSERPEST